MAGAKKAVADNRAIQLLEPFRRILLPVDPSCEDSCINELLSVLDEKDWQPDDFAVWLQTELLNWRTHERTAEFSKLVRRLLVASHSELGEAISQSYFDCHRTLIEKHHLAFDEASEYLSHAYLIVDLAKRYRMSAAQIAKLLNARDFSAVFTRQSVDSILGKLQLSTKLDLESVKLLFDADRERERVDFADSEVATATATVATVAKRLSPQADLYRPLLILAGDQNPSQFSAYLQILHYQTCIAEFYDHAVTDIYEFKPRGEIAKWVFEQYPDSLVKAGNPFLNNAKSVEQLTEGWARSKKTNEQPGAFALVYCLDVLERLGFAGRREVSGWLRRWLHRLIRIAQPITVNVPSNLSALEVNALLQSVANKETSTAGVIEQRVVDFMACCIHTIDGGWRSRGVGDSVNATNVSKRKLGDCDFQDAKNRKVVAYEAHGGVLTGPYFEGHMRVLLDVLKFRETEWESISDLSEWSLEVVFVAHQFSSIPPDPFEHDGVRVSVRFKSFSEFVSEVAKLGVDERLFSETVLLPLNEKRTPNEYRSKFNGLLA